MTAMLFNNLLSFFQSVFLFYVIWNGVLLMSKKKRVAVVFGGQSSEHEVSRLSACSVLKNINRDKYDVVMIGVTKEGRWLNYDGPPALIPEGKWQQAAEQKVLKRSENIEDTGSNSARQVLKSAGAEANNNTIDVIFPVLHGCNGEDGTIQGLLELSGLPYVGCGVLGSALGMDKGFAKIVFEKEGIPQASYKVVNRKGLDYIHGVMDDIEKIFQYPCFVKPCNAGSSVGVSKAHDRGELETALKKAARYDRRILIEEFINGREVECGVLGNDDPIASTVGEIKPCNEFYDYEAKYSSESTSAVDIPADLPPETIEKIRKYAIAAFKALDCCGLSRVDFFVEDASGNIYINEINTIPGFTDISMYPKLWEASGIPYGELIDRLIELAIERHNDSYRNINL